MIALKALKQGFRQAWQYKSIVILLYIMTFVLAAVAAYPLKSLLESTVGHSLMIGDLVKGFDYTFLNDFKNAYGAGFIPIWNQSIVILALYILCFVFLTGGIIATFHQQPPRYSQSIFWGESAHFFYRFLRLSLYFLVVHGLVLGIISFIFYESVHGLSPFELENEATISFNFKIAFPIYILVAAFFFMWHDYTKFFLVAQNKRWIFQVLWKALGYVVKNFRQAYSLYLFNLVLWSLVIYISYKASALIDFDSGTDILVSFLLTQLFILTRYYLKLVNLSSIVHLYQHSQEKN